MTTEEQQQQEQQQCEAYHKFGYDEHHTGREASFEETAAELAMIAQDKALLKASEVSPRAYNERAYNEEEYVFDEDAEEY